MATKLRKFDPNRYKKKDTSYDPFKQLEGLKKRVESVSGDVDKTLDKRNFIEKALNLTPDQNALFDIFEVINRPQQALFGAIRAGQQGKDIGKGALEGLTRKGENAEVRFKEILQAEGLDDSGEKIGVDDILGFAGEIFLDPVDLALIPLTAGGSAVVSATTKLNDAIRVADKAKDAYDVARATAKGVKKGKVVGDRIRALNEFKKASKLLDDAKNALKVAESSVKTTMNSPLQLLFKGAKEGIKKSAKVVDKGIIKSLDHIEKAIKAKNGVDLAETTLKSGKMYKDFKKYIQGIFDASKALPKGLWDKATKNLGLNKLTEARLGVIQKDLVQKIDNVAKKLGTTSDELGEALMFTYEGINYKPVGNLVDDILKNPNHALDEKNFNDIQKLVDKVNDKLAMSGSEPINLNDYYSMRTLKNGVNAYFPKGNKNLDEFSKIVTKNIGEESIKDININMPSFYSEKDLARMNTYMQDPEFKAIYDEFRKTNNAIFATLGEAYGKTLNYNIFPEGYVRHKINPDLPKEVRGLAKSAFDDLNVEGSTSFIKANSDALTGRTYKMSAYEANLISEDVLRNYATKRGIKNVDEILNKKLFVDNIQASTADFIGYSNKFGKETKQIMDILVSQTFENEDFLRPIEKVAKGKVAKVPRGFQAIQSGKLVNRLKEIKPFLEPNLAKSIERAIKKLPAGDTLAIDSNLLMWIGGVVEHEQAGILVQLLDGVNNLFKKNKLLSPGFQMRNFVGNSTNMYLAGMKPDDIISYYKKSDNIIRQGDEIFKRKTLGEVLTPKEEEIYNLYEEFINNNFHEVANELWDIPDSIAKKTDLKKLSPLSKVQDINNNMNMATDKRFRLAMLMWAKDNPQMYEKLGLNSPAEMVRHALFDPTDLSFYEKNVIKKTMPFYTFAKKNLVYQMKNIFDNPKKYKNLEKTIRNIWNAQEIDAKTDLDEYKRNNFWIPLPSKTKDGKYIAVKLNLPVGDLAEFVENPLQRLVSSLSPALRMPFELTANKQMFTGMPIQEFKGQKGYIIPELPRKAEYFVSSLGLDVPTATALDITRTISGLSKNESQGSPFDIANSAIGRSVFSAGDVQKTKVSKAYEEIKEVEDLIKYYKQEGIEIPKLADINGSAKYMQRLKARLQALNNR